MPQSLLLPASYTPAETAEHLNPARARRKSFTPNFRPFPVVRLLKVDFRECHWRPNRFASRRHTDGRHMGNGFSKHGSGDVARDCRTNSGSPDRATGTDRGYQQLRRGSASGARRGKRRRDEDLSPNRRGIGLVGYETPGYGGTDRSCRTPGLASFGDPRPSYP